MAATQEQPVTYLAATDSSIETTDQVIYTGGSQGPPVIFFVQYGAIAIEATCQVA